MATWAIKMMAIMLEKMQVKTEVFGEQQRQQMKPQRKNSPPAIMPSEYIHLKRVISKSKINHFAHLTNTAAVYLKSLCLHHNQAKNRRHYSREDMGSRMSRCSQRAEIIKIVPFVFSFCGADFSDLVRRVDAIQRAGRTAEIRRRVNIVATVVRVPD